MVNILHGGGHNRNRRLRGKSMVLLTRVTASCACGHHSTCQTSIKTRQVRLPWLMGAFLFLLFLCPMTLRAAPVLMTVDTSAISGTAGQIAFDFVDGGSPENNVTVSRFTTNGIPGSSSGFGSVVGNLSTGFTLSDDHFFSEYLLDFVFGTTFSFLLSSTNNPPDINSFPDAFSLFILDVASGQSLTATTDPTGGNALFLLSTGTPSSLDLYLSREIQVTTASVPEPGTIWMVALALCIAIFFGQSWMQSKKSHWLRAFMPRTKLVHTIGRATLTAFGLLLGLSQAFATDVTSTVTVQRGGLVLNRSTNTFDSAVTLTNIGQTSLTPPLRLNVSVTPSSVSLSNGTGVTPDGKSFIEIPLPNGQLNQGQSVKTIIKINNVPRVQFVVTFSVDASVPNVGGLPPDPGPAGLVSLMGVDSDSDGVRDDLQRYIALTYPSSPNTVNALRQLSKTYQEMLSVPLGSVAVAKTVNDKAWRNRSCLVFLHGAREGHKRAKALFAQQFNTADRYRAWSKQDDLLAGQSFESPRDRSATCDFTVIP